MSHSGCSALHGVNPNLKKKMHVFDVFFPVMLTVFLFHAIHHHHHLRLSSFSLLTWVGP